MKICKIIWSTNRLEFLIPTLETSKEFIDYHLIPMVSAIWSMPPYEANKMPLKFFLKFFQNHGLFKLKNRPQWYTVTNRSRAYVQKIITQIQLSICTQWWV